MLRMAIEQWLVLCPLGITAQTVPSDIAAFSLAQRSMAAHLGRSALDDVMLQAALKSKFGPGPDPEDGRCTFKEKESSLSRVDLAIGDDTHTDIHNGGGGALRSNDGTAKAQAAHNCVMDAVYFFPALSSLAQSGNPNYVFKYVGDSVNTGFSERLK